MLFHMEQKLKDLEASSKIPLQANLNSTRSVSGWNDADPFDS